MSLSDVYRASAHAFIGIVEDLSDAELRLTVRACPDWTVHDLLAHQAGASTDVVRRNLDQVASPPWTARQVEERREVACDVLVEEWSGNVDTIAPLCDVVPGPNPAWDVAVHLADLREAVDLPPLPRAHGWGEVLDAALAFVADRSGTTVSVADQESDRGTTTWHFATSYGLWRALFSRLDEAGLKAEITRGDVRSFARDAAFFGKADDEQSTHVRRANGQAPDRP